MPEAVHYRFARPDEVPELARLVAHSFPGAQRPPSYHEEQLRSPRWGGGAETLWVGEESGRLIAACQLHPLRQWVAGAALPSTGVGTVAIAPTHRKRGLAAELVATGLREARARDDMVSALYPFRTAFYQKLGYGQAGEALQYQVPPQTLPDAPERHRVELLDTDAARAEALELYRRWMRSQNGQLERNERTWADVVSAPEQALVGYRGEAGALEGYALVVYRVEPPPRERVLDVDELVWTTPAARRGLYGWLASLDDQWHQILLRALPSDRLGDWLREPRLPRGTAPPWRLWAPGATLLMGPMFRLLDVPAAWELRRVATGPPLAVALDVSDAQIEENAGSWRLVFEEGRTAVERGGTADLTLRLDISLLSRLYIGALPASAAVKAGLLACARPERLAALDALLALPEPWTFDRF